MGDSGQGLTHGVAGAMLNTALTVWNRAGIAYVMGRCSMFTGNRSTLRPSGRWAGLERPGRQTLLTSSAWQVTTSLCLK
jgi:hypothetical protein